MQNVLVIFQATRAATEGLALALGLGAVQRGANIRLRHLQSSSPTELEHQAYGTLGEADLQWAEGIAIVLEADQATDLGQLSAALETAVSRPGWASKLVYVFGENPESAAVRYVRSRMPEGTRVLRDDPAQRVATPAYLGSVGQRIADAQPVAAAPSATPDTSTT